MNESETKSILVGHLLDVMKYAVDENEKFDEFGVKIQSFSYLEEKVWSSIKLIVGMPEIEMEGIFTSDIWCSFADMYITGEISKREAIEYIISWKSKNHNILN